VLKAPLTVTANNQSKFFGDPLPTFTASYSGFVLGDGPMTLGIFSGALSFTTAATATSPVGVYPVTPGGITSSNYDLTFVPGQLTVLPKTTSLTITPPLATQYSDPVTLQATVNPATLGGQAPSGSVEFFINGTSAGQAQVNANGVATLTTPILGAPGSYNVTASFTNTNLNFTGCSGTPVTLAVTQEDARAIYTGALFANTSCATCGTATVPLSATILDITAATGDPAYDPNAGDIRNATVTFINRDTNTPIATVPVNLINAGDTKTGTASFNWNLDIGQANSGSFRIGIVAGGYYARNNSGDDAVVTVSRPLSSGFVTGGGYLVLSNSSGLKAGDPGTRSNFGFSASKSGNTVSGRINLIIRRRESDGVLHIYQVSSNALTSLTGKAPQATISGTVTIKDVTNPSSSSTVESNAAIQITVTDNGEPGSNDTAGITIKTAGNALWFSSSWNGSGTVEQKLGGGNLVVR
jgi:hypothetical protein